MILPTYFQMLQAVIIEDTVIYPLTGSAFTVDLFVLLGIPGYAGLKAQITIVLYVNSAAITAWGTLGSMRTFLNTVASQWAAVFMGVFDRVIPPWAHFVSRLADGMSFFTESDIIRSIFRRLCPAVDINDCIDVPAFQ